MLLVPGNIDPACEKYTPCLTPLVVAQRVGGGYCTRSDLM